MWRPDNWSNPYDPKLWKINPVFVYREEMITENGVIKVVQINHMPAHSLMDKWEAYEASADAILTELKATSLYGEYLEDFIVSAKVKKEDPNWAERFFKTITTKGWLVFIPEEELSNSE